MLIDVQLVVHVLFVDVYFQNTLYNSRFDIGDVVAKVWAGAISIVNTPTSLSDRIRNKLNTLIRYHSGTISNGVANGVPDSIFLVSCSVDMLVVIPIQMPIASGNMYKISFGHAGSP